MDADQTPPNGGRRTSGALTANAVLRRGTSVRLRTMSPLSSHDSKVGDRFDLEVAEDVLLS